MTIANLSSTNSALKEWAITIKALEAGETIILLRKGGIREVSKRFQVNQRQVLLYPTYEHQKPHLLKEKYASQVTPVASGWHPHQVSITSWGNITDILEIRESSDLEAIFPYQIGNEQFVRERWRWQPQKPLSLLFLRVYLLPQPLILDYHPSYGGCRSWLELAKSASLETKLPVFSEKDYRAKVEEINRLLALSF